MAYENDCEGTTHFFEIETPLLTDICQCGEYTWQEIQDMITEQDRVNKIKEELTRKVLH